MTCPDWLIHQMTDCDKRQNIWLSPNQKGKTLKRDLFQKHSLNSCRNDAAKRRYRLRNIVLSRPSFGAGSPSLLLNVRKKVNKVGGTIGKIFGQEKNITTYNLARMNMLLHGVKDTEFEIFHGDTLTNEWDMMREQNPAKKPSFDAIVANPPFSYRWEPTRRWPTTCASKTTASPPNPPPTSPSSCTVSTS